MGEEEEEEEMRMRRRRRRRSSSSRDVVDDDNDNDYDEQEEEEEEEEEDERVLEWEDGLPSADDDLTPLSQHLIPPQLASAFSIKPQPLSTMLDVNRATHKTLSTLLLLLHPTTTTPTPTSRIRGSTQQHHQGQGRSLPSTTIIKTNNLNQNQEEEEEEDPMVVEEGERDDDEDRPATPPPTNDGSETRKIRRRRILLLEEEEEEENNTNNTEEVDSGFRTENSNDDHSARTLKRPRLVWTPQLHKRFVDVVAHLGIKNAVPKTIMQLMNVEGLTRENVASHLQKYRLYLKPMQGLSNEGPSSSDPLFASTPVPHTLHDPPTGSTSGKQQQQQQHISHPPLPPPPPMPYGGNMLPMPVLGHAFGNPAAAAAAAYQGFEFHPYGMFRDQQRDRSGNRFGPMVSYPKASK